MALATTGNTVKVHYTGKLTDGTIFDSSENREPLEFTLGEGQVIPGFENAVVGMTIGEAKSVTIPADEAYGPHRAELMLTVERAQFPEGLEPQVGQQLQLQQDGAGMPLVVVVATVTDADVTLDANHPLAGQDLTFDITLEAIA